MTALRPREKRLVYAMAALAAVLVLAGCLVMPALERIRTLERDLPKKERELRDLAAKTRQVLLLTSQVAAARQSLPTGPTGEVLPMIESIVNRHGLQPNLASLTPQRTSPEAHLVRTVVEMGLLRLTLRQVLDLLGEVHTTLPAIRITRLHLTRHPEGPGWLNVTATLCSLGPAGGA